MSQNEMERKKIIHVLMTRERDKSLLFHPIGIDIILFFFLCIWNKSLWKQESFFLKKKKPLLIALFDWSVNKNRLNRKNYVETVLSSYIIFVEIVSEKYVSPRGNRVGIKRVRVNVILRKMDLESIRSVRVGWER